MGLILLKIIALVEIIGGIWGGSLMFYRMLLALDDLKVLFLLMAYLVPFALSISAGVLLLKQKATGFKLSLLTQFLQIPYFAIGGIYYSFLAGLLLGFRVSYLEDATNYNFNLLFGGYCQVQFGLPANIIAIGVNLSALIIFALLLYLQSFTSPVNKR